LMNCGSFFLSLDSKLKHVNIPQLITCGDRFLLSCEKVKTLILPNLNSCGFGFMQYNLGLEELYLPQLPIEYYKNLTPLYRQLIEKSKIKYKDSEDDIIKKDDVK